MKTFRFLILLPLWLALGIHAQTFYTESQIGTYVRQFSGWNMQSTRQFNLNLSSQSLPFTAANIVGVAVHIYNNSRTEVYPLTRQAELAQHDMTGGNFEIEVTPPVSGGQETILIRMDRGFYETGSFYSLFANSGFNSSTAIRGQVKIEYISTSPASQARPLWLKMGPKNADQIGYDETFVGQRGSAHLTTLGLTVDRLVGTSAVMHSDPNPDGDVHVNPLARVSGYNASNVGWGRGGKIYVAGGKVNWGTGPYNKNFSRTPCKSVYRTCPNGNVFTHTSLAANRGWARVDYTGSQVAYPMPYAVKTKVRALGNFAISSDLAAYDFPWDFGIHTSRVMGIATTLRSDPVSGKSYYNELHRVQLAMGHNLEEQPQHRGGITTLDGPQDKLTLNVNPFSYFSANRPHGGSVTNRGYVKVDYLAGSCEEGPSGFTIQAVPGVWAGNCEPVNQPSFALYGAGRGFVTNGTSDDFALVSKASTAANRTLTVKYSGGPGIDPGSLGGLTFRSTSGAGSMHASLVGAGTAASGNGIHFWRRTTTSAPNTLTQVSDSYWPIWLRLRKTGNVFSAYYAHDNGGSVPPDAAFILVGQQTVNLSSTYQYGFVASNGTSEKLGRLLFENYQEQTGIVGGTIYRIMNVNSNKALEISGSSIANGGNAAQWDYLGGNNQKWRVVDAGQGYWKIINLNSGKALDVSGAGTGDGANIHQWTDMNAANQQWQITDLGDGSFRVVARHSGKSMDVAGSSTANGANVHQWTSQNGNNQRWRFITP